MWATECIGRPVLDMSTAATLARVEGLVVDPGEGRVVALRLGGRGRKVAVLLWEDVAAFGPDAVTVTDGEVLRRVEDVELPGDGLEPLGRRVLTELGDELGSVQDVGFDASTGQLDVVVTQSAQVAGDELLGIGSYALVVRSPEVAEETAPPS